VSAAAPQAHVIAVGAGEGRALRHAVLRPHEPPGRPTYEQEDDATTLHFAAVDASGEVLSVGSVMAEAHPREPREGDWRVRGMATAPELRGLGLGARVLAALEAAAAARGAQRLWCNARSGARAFYERAGFSVEGEEFELPDIGPHFLMSRPLR
jgi:GNAT superfamily N-acetyltransferase